jgi:hypothetical protein
MQLCHWHTSCSSIQSCSTAAAALQLFNSRSNSTIVQQLQQLFNICSNTAVVQHLQKQCNNGSNTSAVHWLQ